MNLPERRDNSLAASAISGGGMCSQKSVELGVLNNFSPGIENRSSGVMIKVLELKVGVDMTGATVGVDELAGTRLGAEVAVATAVGTGVAVPQAASNVTRMIA